MLEVAERATSGLSKRERSVLMSLLRRVVENLDE
jgi:hypothetical protein